MAEGARGVDKRRDSRNNHPPQRVVPLANDVRESGGAAAFDSEVILDSLRSRPEGWNRRRGRTVGTPCERRSRRGGKKRVDTRAGLPYTSPPLGNEVGAKAAQAAISASVL